MEYISHTISDKEAKRLEKMEKQSNEAEAIFRKFLWKLSELGLVVKYRTMDQGKGLEYLTEHMTRVNLIRDPGYDKMILEITYNDNK